jgi:hypothetical protein
MKWLGRERGSLIFIGSVSDDLILGPERKDLQAETVIVEQAALIEDYHKELKEAVERSSKLEKELGFYKRHSKSQSEDYRGHSEQKKDKSLGKAKLIHIKDDSAQNS